LARQGNIPAKCEVGRKYLSGADGFPRRVATGLEYLTHPSVKRLPEVSRTIAESLTLPEILRFAQEEALQLAATSGSIAAQLKLGVWNVIRYPNRGDGMRLLRTAAHQGHLGAVAALGALERKPGDSALVESLVALSSSEGGLDSAEVSTLAAEQALSKRDVASAARCLRVALGLTADPSDAVAELVLSLVLLAEESADSLGLPASSVQACLEKKCVYGDYSGGYTLGRALCGIHCGHIKPSSLASSTNFRKGAALLLRAADGGCTDAWLHLYRVHSDHSLSVANPQMARFCLEKAATAGNTEAQRKLGATLMRESGKLRESEQGISWLFAAAQKGDDIAQQLLKTLVIPVQGSDADAKLGLDAVSQDAPWLAVRLQLARDFGLTKLEALTVDPAAGVREWGLVIGQNPFISQRLVSSPRAVPAITEGALVRLQAAADFFAELRREGGTVEGDLRHRSRTQRTAFERHRLSEPAFFAQVSSAQLEVLRQGPKWAVRVKDLLAAALATESLLSEPEGPVNSGKRSMA